MCSKLIIKQVSFSHIIWRRGQNLLLLMDLSTNRTPKWSVASCRPLRGQFGVWELQFLTELVRRDRNLCRDAAFMSRCVSLLPAILLSSRGCKLPVVSVPQITIYSSLFLPASHKHFIVQHQYHLFLLEFCPSYPFFREGWRQQAVIEYNACPWGKGMTGDVVSSY